MPGGELQIEIGEGYEMGMTGSVGKVFDGQLAEKLLGE
jgi:diaminopimelate epimerase